MNSITRWNKHIIFHWHQKTLGDACKTLGKTDLLDSNTACPSWVFLWNVIWVCVWKWECITERSRWWESVAKDKRGEKRQDKKRKKCLRTYCSLVQLGSLCSLDMKRPTSVLWQAMRSKVQRARDMGEERRGVEVHGQTGSQRSSIKQEKGQKDQGEESS